MTHAEAGLEREARRLGSPFGRGITVAATIVPLLATLGAMLLAGVKAKDLAATNEQLVRAKADLDSTVAGRDRTRSETDELSSQKDLLQKELEGLRAEKQRVEQAAKITDPQAALAGVRRELGGDAASSPRAQAVALWSSGYSSYQAGDRKQAKQYYVLARKADPTFAAPVNSLGRLAQDEGDTPSAEAMYEQALQLEPTYVPALNNLAGLRVRQGKLDDAKQLVQKALVQRPQYAPAQQILTLIESKQRAQDLSPSPPPVNALKP